MKVIGTYSNEDMRKVVKVGRFPFVYCTSTTAICTEVLQRGCDVEMPSPSQCPSPNRGINVGRRFTIVSGWMPNGDTNQFVKAHPEVNCLRLVRPPFAALLPSILWLKFLQLAGVAEVLFYLHGDVIVHGDLGGVIFG